MDFIFALLGAAGTVISLYALVCVGRVFITWSPSLAYSSFGRLLAQICDPWLNLFRRFNFTKRSRIDVSPMIAIAVLMLVSTIFSEIARTGVFSFAMIFSITLRIFWSILSSLFTFFNILVLIRLIAELLNKNTGSIWQNIDQILNPVMKKVVGIFSKNRFLQLKFSLAILLACGVILQFLLGRGIVILISVLLR